MEIEEGGWEATGWRVSGRRETEDEVIKERKSVEAMWICAWSKGTSRTWPAD